MDPEKQLRECLKQCELLQPGMEGEQCRRECRQRYCQQQHLDEGGEEQQEQEEKDYSFVFRDQNFASVRTDMGEMRILEKFDQRSRLLRGLKNYRFISLEANPQTFVVPTHYDADIVGFLSRGKYLLLPSPPPLLIMKFLSISISDGFAGQGTITMVCQGKRRGFRIRTGDIVRIPAGRLFS